MWEQLKILHHQEAIYGKRIPIHVQIELTERCNHQCIFCHNHNKDKSSKLEYFDFTGTRDFPYDRLVSLIYELKCAGTKAISFTGTGEPLLYKGIWHIIHIINDLGMEWGITTNLDSDLTKEDMKLLSTAKWIRASVNGWNHAGYAYMHGIKNNKSFDRVISNLERLHDLGANVNVSYVVTHENQQGIVDVVDLVKNIANSLSFRHEAGSKRIKEKSLEPEVYKLLQKAKEQETKDFKVYDGLDRLDEDKLIDEDLNCYISNHLVFIAANGDVYPCCTTRWDIRYVYGNTLNKNFKDFWYERNGNEINMRYCPPCRHYQDNKVLDMLYNKEKDNFI